MNGYIINTDPHWLSFLFTNGIKRPVFWLKRNNNPNNSSISIGHPIFFRITGTNPPVIRGYGVIANVLVRQVSEAFLAYGSQLGYATVDEMISTSENWTSGVSLNTTTNIFCIEIEQFKVTKDIRTDIELANIEIQFDHKHVVTGKGLNNTQTESLLTLAKSREIEQVSSLVTFIKDNVGSYVVPEFNPNDIQDAREFVARLIAKRRGQPEFRQKLFQAYDSKCAITGCEAVPALEAAHIIPYQGDETNHISNGLLLRADIHTLFDLGLLAIDTTEMKVVVHPNLINTEYADLMGKSLCLPANPAQWPNKIALDIHRKESGI